MALIMTSMWCDVRYLPVTGDELVQAELQLQLAQDQQKADCQPNREHARNCRCPASAQPPQGTHAKDVSSCRQLSTLNPDPRSASETSMYVKGNKYMNNRSSIRYDPKI